MITLRELLIQALSGPIDLETFVVVCDQKGYDQKEIRKASVFSNGEGVKLGICLEDASSRLRMTVQRDAHGHIRLVHEDGTKSKWFRHNEIASLRIGEDVYVASPIGGWFPYTHKVYQLKGSHIHTLHEEFPLKVMPE